MRNLRSWLITSCSALSLLAIIVTCAGKTQHGAGSAFAGSVVPDGNAARDSIPPDYRWKLDAVFPNDEAHDRALEKAAEKRTALAAYKGKLADPKMLRECLELYFATRLLTNQVTLYANLRFDTDQKSSSLRGRSDRSLAAMNDLMSTAGFIRQEILALDDGAMSAAYKSQPKLDGYRPYIDELRRRRSRVLDSASEHILSLAGDNLWAEIDLNELPSDHEKTFGALISEVPLPTIKDEKGVEIPLTLSNYGKYRASPDRRVRRDTVESFFGALRKFENAFAGTFSGQIRFNVFLARSRGYPSAIQAYLDKDDIDPAVYRNLIGAVRANLAPLHRYVALRKKVMNLSDLHIYDLYPPMVPSVKIEYRYDEAARALPEALSPLGKEYIQVLRQGLDPRQGWIDVYPHKDKDSGAFSASVFGIHPYIKMNWYDQVDDFSTLAHEYGHALHSHLSMKNQPYVTSNYAPFIAEIASTFNEKLLSDYLLGKAKTDDERLYLLNELVETIRTTIYRQTLFADFELAAHSAAEAGTPLTAEFLDKTYRDLIATYYGKDFTIGDNDGIEWAYIPHFYYKYYMYSYATGLSSGIALAELVTRDGPKARDAYLGMLKGGSSKPPLELLKEAGVDLSRPDAIEAAAKLMNTTLGTMEGILAKRKAGG